MKLQTTSEHTIQEKTLITQSTKKPWSLHQTRNFKSKYELITTDDLFKAAKRSTKY